MFILFTDCVIFPAWWLYSIKKNFPELWEQNCCGETLAHVDPKSGAFVKEEEIISSSSIPKENLVPRRDFLKPQMMKGLSINVKRNPRKLILPSLKLNDMVIIEI